MTVGERIKCLRKSKKMPLKELSQKVCISTSFLSDIENNRSNPSLERLRDISIGLDTTMSYLLGEYAPASEARKQFGTDSSINEPAKNDDFADNIYSELLQNTDFRNLLHYLLDFSKWNEEDKKELLAYLKVKKTARESGGI